MPNTSPRNSNPEELPLIPGYIVESVLGRGAMSTVYLGRQVDMDRLVAIKVMSDAVAVREDLVEQLLDEAKIAASVTHPNIIRALDAGIADGRCFFVMEFIDGETLRDRILREGPLPHEEVRQLGILLARALNELDRQRLVHRDVKPANILLGKRGEVCLADFGLASFELGLSEGGDARTVGTPQYMSPEQILDPANIDSRSDLFSLGSTLFHALVGTCPFEAKGAGESLSRVLYEAPPPVQSLNPELPSDLCGAVDSLLVRDREARCPSPAAFIAQLKLASGAPPRRWSPQMTWGAAGVLMVALSAGVFLTTVDSGSGGPLERHQPSGSGGEIPSESERLAAIGDHDLFALITGTGNMPSVATIIEGQRRLQEFMGVREAAVVSAVGQRSFDEAARLCGDDLLAAFSLRFGATLSELPISLFESMNTLRRELEVVRRKALLDDQDGLLNIFCAACDAREVVLIRDGDWTSAENVSKELVLVAGDFEDDWNLLAEDGREQFRNYCREAAARVLDEWHQVARTELRELEVALEGRLFQTAERGIRSLQERGVCSLTPGWEAALARLSSEIKVTRQGLRRAIQVANDSIRLPRPDGAERFEGRPINGLKLVLEPSFVLLPEDLSELGSLLDEAKVLRRLHEVVTHLASGDTPQIIGQRALLAHLDGRFESVLEDVSPEEADSLLQHIRAHSAAAHSAIHHVSSSLEQQARERLQDVMTLMESRQWDAAAEKLQALQADSSLKNTEWFMVFGQTVKSLADQMAARQSLLQRLGKRQAAVRILNAEQRLVQLSWGEGKQYLADFKMSPAGSYRAMNKGMRRVTPSKTMSPSMIGGLRTTFPWQEGSRLLMCFTYEPGTAAVPCLMVIRTFGLNTTLLSRLPVPAKQRSAVLHGWGEKLISYESFGWGDTFFGPLSETGTRLLRPNRGRHVPFFEKGRTYRIQLELDDVRRRITVTINGVIAHRAAYDVFRALDDRVGLMIPMEHEIRDLTLEGILREE